MNAKLHLIATLLAGGIAISLAIVSWVQIQRLSLSCPLFLPMINVLLPVLALVVSLLSSRVKGQMQIRAESIVHYLTEATKYATWVLIAMSLMFAIPSDTLSCGLESQWSHMFRRKDESGIRAIQNALRCCGFNSLHDRAWPFPAREVDAAACERIQGYVVRCADPWSRQESIAATLLAFSSFFNWLVLVLIINHEPYRESHLRQIGSERQRLLEEESHETTTQPHANVDRGWQGGNDDQ